MSSVRFRSLILAGAIAAFATSSRLAFAADPSPQDIAQARELSVQAQAAHDAGNYAEAEKLWTAAQNLYPGAATVTLGLARTQTKLGKLVLAQESYNRIIREQTSNPSPLPAFKDALVSAQNEVGAVSARIANVVITIEGGAANPTVTIDNQPISAAGLGLKRPIDPGAHVVKAEAPGYKPAEASFQVSEAGLAEAKLKLEKSPDAVAGGAPAGDNQNPAVIDSKKGGGKTLAYVAFGVGAVGLAFGAVTGILALGKHGDLSDQCPGDKCTSDKQSDIDSYKTMGTLSTVGFIVGGVGIAAGAVLWFTAPKEGSAKNDAPGAPKKIPVTAKNGGMSWQPYVTVGGAGVAGRF